MYKRSLDKPPASIIERGKIHFGSFLGASPRLDIRGVKRPFADSALLSSPIRALTNLRIKSTLTYVFTAGRYFGLVTMFDDKIFGLADVVIWDATTSNSRHFSRHRFMGIRRHFIPHDTTKASATCFGKSKFIKVLWNKNAQKLTLQLDLANDAFHPAIKARLFSRFGTSATSEVQVVNGAPTPNRCKATWIVSTPATGGVKIAKKARNLGSIPQKDGLALFTLSRVYQAWHTKSMTLWALGRIDGRDVSLTLTQSTQDALDADNSNENFLFVNGEATALPSVLVTHPFGPSGRHIIQDTEGMVDLSFEPRNTLRRTVNVIIMRNAYEMTFGFISGTLKSNDGTVLTLKNFGAAIKKSVVRV